LHHLAFVAPSRAAVEESARWLRERGACIESGPADYDYAPRYFAVFFRDPDGLKLEIVHRPRERDLAATVRELSDRLAQLERRS
jgi:catechol-2,3-dioxygenase